MASSSRQLHGLALFRGQGGEAVQRTGGIYVRDELSGVRNAEIGAEMRETFTHIGSTSGDAFLKISGPL